MATLVLLGNGVYFGFVGEDPTSPTPLRIRGMDLVSYWVGGEILAEGHGDRLYVPAENHPHFKRLYPPRPPHYPIGYPPPIYQVFQALTGFDYFSAIKVVLIALAALHALGARWCVDALPALKPWRREALAAALLLPGGLSAVSTGQPGGVWTAALGAAMVLRLRGNRGLAGGVLSLLFLKPTLAAPLMFALALTGEWAMVGGMVAGGVGILGLSLLAGGLPAWEAYLEKLANPGKFMASFWIWWSRQITFRSWLPKFFENTPWADRVGWACMALAAGFLGWVSVLAARVRRRGEAISTELAFGATISAALFAAPHMLDYDFGLHLPALLAAGLWLLSGRARWPKTGWVLLALTWSAAWYPPANRIVLLNLCVTAIAAWLIWLALELRAEGRGAPTGSTTPAAAPMPLGAEGGSSPG